MRKSFIPLFITLVFLWVTPQAFGAGQIKIKFLQAVYDGGSDIGLRYPEGVACTDDYFIVGDTGNNRLVKFTLHDSVVKAGEFDMPVTAPVIVQVNSKGEIFALDGRDRRILILNPDGTEKGYLNPKGSPVARKMLPKSFKIGRDDRTYILDISGALVLVLDQAGNYIKHIPLPGQYGFISDLAVDERGQIFLIDSVDGAIYSATPEADGFSLLTQGLEEYANFPTHMTLDNSGIIYLVDKHGGSLVLLNRDGTFMGHRFGYGWKESQFYYPTQICISRDGKIYVADRNNSRVQIFEITE